MRARLRRKLLLLGGFVALGGCSPVVESAPPARPRAVAFVDVTVIPMDHEGEAAHQTVIVEGDRIVSVGPAALARIPVDAERIDGRGQFLMPGLADMHVHLSSTADLTLFVANGVTTVRNMAGWPLHLLWKRRVIAGELFGPTIFTAGPIADDHPHGDNATVVVTRPEDAERAVLAQARDGYDFFKVYNGLSPDVFSALARAAQLHGMRVVGHVPDGTGLAGALAEGMSSIEHLDGFPQAAEADASPLRGKEGRQAWLARPFHQDAAKTADLAARFRAAGAWSCPTLITKQRFYPTPEQAEEWGHSTSPFVTPILRAYWASRVKARPEALLTSMRQYDAMDDAIVRALHDAGVPTLAGSDTPNAFVAPGFSLPKEIANLHHAGLSNYEALAAATSEAARYLHDDAGIVKPGRRADLLLVRLDPLGDVTNLRFLAGVMLRGHWLPKAALARRMDEVVASYVPREHRFEGRAPIGETAIRYDVAFGGVSIGEERIVESPGANGYRLLRAQAVTDGPDNLFYDVSAELDASGRLETLHASSDPLEGHGELTLTRARSEFRLSGQLPFYGPVDRYGYAPDELLLGRSLRAGTNYLDGPLVLGARLLGPRLAGLPVGGGALIPTRSIQLDPELDFSEGEIVATRRPDRENGRRVYDLVFGTHDVQEKRTLVLDDSGQVETIEAGPWIIRRYP